METAKVVSIGNRTAVLNPGPINDDVSIGRTLTQVTVIVGTAAFDDEFTKHTGIEVGNLGQVGDLEELLCPHWFLSTVFQQILMLYHSHLTEFRGPSGEIDEALSLAYAAASAQFVAYELANEYAIDLINAAFDQFSTADVWPD